MKNKLEKISMYLCSIILVCIDQISKIVVINNLNKFPIQVIKNFISFNYCENRGVAFSMGDGNVSLFIILNIILIGGLIYYYEKNKQEFNKFSTLSITLVIAGGFSNLLDRIFRGFVVDFIDISELFDFPVFNIADIFIVVGIIGLMFSIITSTERNTKNEKNSCR